MEGTSFAVEELRASVFFAAFQNADGILQERIWDRPHDAAWEVPDVARAFARTRTDRRQGDVSGDARSTLSGAVQ
jgi:hypothetical protein